MPRIRIGFIGAGENARRRHLPGFARLAGIELTAVANRTRSSSRRVAHEFGIKSSRSHWQEVISDPQIDAVCIGTWPNTHAPMTTAALAAGKHVLVEARMARSWPEAKSMSEAARACPALVTQVVPSPITLEADAIIARMIQAGELGDLLEVISEHSSSATLDSSAPLSWRMDHRISGVNTMALGICYEPMQRWLGGDAVVTSAHAEVITPIRQDETGADHGVKIPERLEVRGHWGDARLLMRQSSVVPGPARFTYRLVGTQGTLAYDVMDRQLMLDPIHGPRCEIELPGRLDGGWQVEAQFVESIRVGTPVTLTDFPTGLRYMRFTDSVWSAWNHPRDQGGKPAAR